MIQWGKKRCIFFQFNFCYMRTTFEDVMITNVNCLCACVMRIKRVVMYYQEHFIPGCWTFGRKWKKSKDARYEQNQFHFRRYLLLKKNNQTCTSEAQQPRTRHLMCVLNIAKAEKSLSCVVFRPLSHWPEGWNFDELIWLHNAKCSLSARSSCKI